MARTIGKDNLSKLRIITRKMWLVDHNVSEDTVCNALPAEWFEVWEAAWQEIHREVWDTLSSDISIGRGSNDFSEE